MSPSYRRRGNVAKPPAVHTRSASSRLLLGAVVFALILAGACGVTNAASSRTAGTLSAHLTKKAFTRSQAAKVKLVYKFSAPSKSFSYRLTFKKGSKWVLVKSVKKQGSFSGKKTTAVKKLFAGKPVKLGSYKLKLACDGGSKSLSFKVIKVAKPATKPGGGTTTTPTVTTPTGSAPVNTGVPAISGTTTQGQTLTASNGAWNNSPTSFGYQWERCSASCSAISGVIGNAYVLVAADVSLKIRVSVTATNAYGSTTVTSSQTAPVAAATPPPPGAPPANTALPVISGTPETTKTLHASTGTWTNSPTSFTYQWFSCDTEGGDCDKIPAATSSDYTTTVDDVFWTVRVTVTAANATGSATATSVQSGIIQPGGPVPENVNLPVITGEAWQGAALHASTGDWTNSPTSYLYLWYACDPAITSCWTLSDDVSSNTYIPDADDVGSVIGVFVMAYNAYGFGSAYSDMTGVVVVAPELSFTPHNDFSVGMNPRSVAIGDFNGDGRQDLAVGNWYSGNVSVLLGDGVGSFGAKTDFSAGSPESVAIGDFNGDGKQDLATANWSGNVSVLLGTGTGSFGAATYFSVGATPWDVAVGDFNGDGRQDLAVANTYPDNVSVLLGDGTGSFGAATNFSVGTHPSSVAVSDFNGDGKQDLAVANQYASNVSVLLGDGTGSFGTATNFGVDTSPFSVAVGDFNGDGKQDLATANWGQSISVLLGTGAGSFGYTNTIGVAATLYDVAVGDLNGDGNQDLAAASYSSSYVSVLLGTGTGSFGVATNFLVGSQPFSVAIGDFNGDGRRDLAVVANDVSGTVSILLNTTGATP